MGDIKRGNFKFLMQSEGMTFVETVKKLASRYGIPIPETITHKNVSSLSGEREFLLNLNQKALDYFRNKLRQQYHTC